MISSHGPSAGPPKAEQSFLITPGFCYKNHEGKCVGKITTPDGKVFHDSQGFAYLRRGESLSMWEGMVNQKDLVAPCGCSKEKK